MEMKMLLLVSAAILLAGPALMFPALSLNHIIDIIDKPNKTLNEDVFVEKVPHAGCKEEFFCKVHHILQKNAAFRANTDGEKIVRNLGHHINGTKLSCPVVPKNRTIAVTIKLGALLESLKECIREFNFSG
ncbi:unnamed protein product [Ophioblennius macclurei]